MSNWRFFVLDNTHAIGGSVFVTYRYVIWTFLLTFFRNIYVFLKKILCWKKIVSVFGFFWCLENLNSILGILEITSPFVEQFLEIFSFRNLIKRFPRWISVCLFFQTCRIIEFDLIFCNRLNNLLMKSIYSIIKCKIVIS